MFPDSCEQTTIKRKVYFNPKEKFDAKRVSVGDILFVEKNTYKINILHLEENINFRKHQFNK